MEINLTAISEQSIFRPCILIPCPDRCHSFDCKGNIQTAECRMWGIRYRMIDRTGYEENLFTEQENKQVNLQNGTSYADSVPLFLNDTSLNLCFRQNIHNHIDSEHRLEDVEEEDEEKEEDDALI